MAVAVGIEHKAVEVSPGVREGAPGIEDGGIGGPEFDQLDVIGPIFLGEGATVWGCAGHNGDEGVIG